MKNTIFILNILVLCVVSILYSMPLTVNIYQLTDVNLFFRIAMGLIGGLTLLDVFIKRKELLTGITPFRIFTAIFASAIIAVYFYNHKTPLGLSIVLLLLCLIYGIYKRTFYKPHSIMIALFAFCVLKLLSCLWATDSKQGFAHIDYYSLFIFVPIASCFFRIEKKELKPFIYTAFSFFLGIMTLLVVAYVFLVKQYDKPLLAFLSFNKSYMGDISYYELINWTKTNHPSKIAWICMAVFAMGLWLWKTEKGKIINTLQIVLYGILLIAISFMLQARIAILGSFILIGLSLWIALMKYIANTKYIVLCTLLAAVMGLWLTKVVITNSSYFNDPIRNTMNATAINSFNQYPIFGGGAGHESLIIKEAGYDYHGLHNDFLTTLVDNGLIGIALFLFFHILVVYYAIKQRYMLSIYLLTAFVIFNTTEGVIGISICIPFFFYTLIPPLYRK
ncbi:O-antigen ligase family protein [Capnocytophaga leadbetteri]|uniref:O-antigen ligase family protein n=2 Tax=Capnocytophaga leadbetteri TaxID=327575 RepID=UPI0028E3E5AD|nr:O-antigen ligase family protein [Capnocytophaga leadbetteri]